MNTSFDEYDFENRVISSDCDIDEIDDEYIRLHPIGIKDLVFSDEIKNHLTNYVSYIKSTGDTANLLLIGCPTQYISMIANVIANELGVYIREIDCSKSKSGDLSATLTNIAPGDVVGVTNTAEASAEIMGILKQALIDYKLTITIGKGPSARIIQMTIPKFCAVVSVNNASLFSADMMEPFYYVIDFNKNKKELFVVEITDFALKYNLNICDSIIEEIANHCSDSEQLKLKLISIRNQAFESNTREITSEFLHGDSSTITEFEEINNLSGREFELFAGKLLQDLGYTNVTVTQSSCDFGADVIAEKDDVRFAIQCKRYSAPVGVSAVQEVLASKSLHDCHVACILTNNTFTPAAEELAKKNLVILWGCNKLKEFIERTK